MKITMTAISVAALLSAGSFAIAQDAGVSVGVDAGAGVSVETPAVDATIGAGADVSADTSYESLTTALSGSANADLTTVTDQSQVMIVLLSSISGEVGAFDEAFAANADGNTTLHGNISGNAAISAKLEAEGYTADDVVAVKSNADGSVLVYVDDRS
jgi:hypothetical protein